MPVQKGRVDGTASRVFYRGAAGDPTKAEKPTFWSPNIKNAQGYAKLRGGQIYATQLKNFKYIYADEAGLAREFKVYDQWIALRVKGDNGPIKAQNFILGKTKQAGYDVIIQDEQVVVLNPRILEIVSVGKIHKNQTKAGRPRISQPPRPKQAKRRGALLTNRGRRVYQRRGSII